MLGNDEKLVGATRGDEVFVLGRGGDTETPSGHVETWKTKVAFRRGTEHFRGEVLSVRNFYRSSDSSDRVVQETKITSTQYAALIAGKKSLDVAAIRGEQAKREAATDALEAARPMCPKCRKRRLKAKYASTNKEWFWGGCVTPDCRGSKSMTAAEKRLARAAPPKRS